MPEDQQLDALREKAVKQQLDISRVYPYGNVQELYDAIRTGDRQSLARAITLAESHLKEDRDKTAQLIQLGLSYLHTARRIGITGIPGVGKSTLINALAGRMADKGNRVAILTIDPSSPQSKGSILGDKTRMQDLITREHVFIRPSPSGNKLGGVSLRTREAACLCEIAGFDTILIETVGVGQSETDISNMTDFFLLLALPGAGDDLQGIKRGIIELADAIFVNKADGAMAKLAEVATQTYKQSLLHFPSKANKWTPVVLSGAALSGEGVDHLLDVTDHFFQLLTQNGCLAANRERQNKLWMHDALQEMIALRLSDPVAQSLIEKMEPPVAHKEISAIAAATAIFRELFQQ